MVADAEGSEHQGGVICEVTRRAVLPKIVSPDLDRRAVRRAVGSAVPGVVIARELGGAAHALGRDETFQRVEPVMIVGLAGVGIARRLGTLDLLAERRRPFGPGEHAARMQRERHGEGLRFPRLAEYRTFSVAGNARHRGGGAAGSGAIDRGHDASSRYGSNASIDTLSVGSPSSPHNSRPSNTTV